MIRKFDCDWHTAKGPGIEYYSGVEHVELNDDGSYAADDELFQAAEDMAQVRVWRRAFQDRPRSHIIVWNVTESRNIQRERDEWTR